LAVLCGALPSPADAQNVQWSPFTSKEFPFSISLCSTPSRVEKKNIADGTTNIVAATAGDIVCIVSMTDFNVDLAVEQEFKEQQATFLKSINGVLGNSRRVAFKSRSGTLPALRFTFRMKSARVGTTMAIIEGRRFYMLCFTFPEDKDYATALETFIDSFQILK
jgi:hypothetical protein